MENLCNGLWHQLQLQRGPVRLQVEAHEALKRVKGARRQATNNKHTHHTPHTHKAHTWCVHVHKKCINFERHQHVLHTHTTSHTHVILISDCCRLFGLCLRMWRKSNAAVAPSRMKCVEKKRNIRFLRLRLRLVATPTLQAIRQGDRSERERMRERRERLAALAARNKVRAPSWG